MSNNESTNTPCANHKAVLAMKDAYVKQWGSGQLPVDLETAQKNKPKVGRPAKESINPIHDIAKELLVKGEDESFPTWLDNILFGSCITSAGQSGNVSNVSPPDVVGALHLPEFKVQPLLDKGVGVRKAQRVIGAARHAAHGIHNHLLSNPHIMKVYKDRADIEYHLSPYNNLEAFPVKDLKPVPDEIMALRGDGSLEALVAYGDALRAFRQQS